MFRRLVVRRLARPAPGVKGAGVAILVLSVLGLVVGLMLIDSMTRDFRATIEVSRSAIRSVGETVEVMRSVAEETTDSVEAASLSAASAAATARGAAGSLEDIADFLDSSLPENLEAIRSALPAAIDAAAAIDGTLRALSLFGVDYQPEEPFDDSLRRLEGALAELPRDIRVQSDSLRLLVPSADVLADDVDALAASLEELRLGLDEVDGLADAYTDTVVQAQAAIQETDESLERTTWLLRIMLIIAATGGVVIGLALISTGRVIDTLTAERPALPETAGLVE